MLLDKKLGCGAPSKVLEFLSGAAVRAVDRGNPGLCNEWRMTAAGLWACDLFGRIWQ